MGIPADYLAYPLDPDERARSEREDGDLLIILRIPHFQGEGSDIPYTTVPLGIILTPDYLVTVVRVGQRTGGGAGLGPGPGPGDGQAGALRAPGAAADLEPLPVSQLRQMTRAIDALEDELQESTRNREVLELLKYQKSLTFFTTALRSNELMMERLQRSQWFASYPDDEDLLEDVITENRQAIEMTNITGNILSSMMDAFASIISNNLNRVMKLLASITIVRQPADHGRQLLRHECGTCPSRATPGPSWRSWASRWASAVPPSFSSGDATGSEVGRAAAAFPPRVAWGESLQGGSTWTSRNAAKPR